MKDFTSQPTLTGHGLVLRRWTDSDEDLSAAVDVFDDPDVAHRTPLVSPFDLAAARDYLNEARKAQVEGQRVHLAITTDGRQAKGEVRLNLTSGSISYVVGPAHRGQRLAARAVQLIIDYAHRVLDLHRVMLEIEPSNRPSIAVAQAAGFHLTDIPPSPVLDKGRSYTLLTWVHTAP